MSSPYTGSLLTKRKADLSEIASALGLPDADAKVSELIKNIQNHLEVNETTLSKSPAFKGLYSKRGRHQDSDSETPMAEVKTMMEGQIKRGRKSLNKTFDRFSNIIDPSNIALPESPVNFHRISDAADAAKDAANNSMSVALAPAQNLSRDLSTRFNHAQRAVVKFGHDQQRRVDLGVRTLRDYLSQPEYLVTSAVIVELLFLLGHVVQSYDHTVYFPPPGSDKGTISSLLRSLFFWLPTFSLTFRLPEMNAFKSGTDIWPAVAWWFSTTVLPPLALSTVVSFIPQKGVARTGHNTRYSAAHPPAPSPDPFSFSLFRLALLIYPLTSAAPSAMVDALEMSGNLQGRALGAALLAGLMLADRL